MARPSFNISWLTYDNKSFSLSGQTYPWTKVQFKPDWTKMYILGREDNWWNQIIYQYSLSTAWDVSTASYDNKSFNLYFYGSSSIIKNWFYFKPDWLAVFYLDYYGQYIRKRLLSTAWDVSTIGNVNQNYWWSEALYCSWLFFKDDWMNFFVTRDQGYPTQNIMKFSLSTAWDLTTASYVDSSWYLLNDVFDLSFKDDGKKVFFARYETIRQYPITTARWTDVGSSESSKNTWTWQTVWFYFKPDDWSKLYIIKNNVVYQYTTYIPTTSNNLWYMNWFLNA